MINKTRTNINYFIKRLSCNSLLKLNELKELHKNKNIFQYNNCLCGSNDDELIAIEDRYGLQCNFVICKNCGLIRMNPYYTEDFINVFYKEFYSPIYRNGNYCSDEHFQYARDIRGKYIINRIENYIRDIDFKDLKVFEIGCGSGGILKAFQNKGCVVYGVDYGKDYLEFAKNEGLNVFEGNYERLKEFGKCDILIINHCLEHITKPIEFLISVKELVKNIIYIEVPTLESIPINYNSDFSLYFSSAHIWNFSDTLFENYVKICGFKIVNQFIHKALILKIDDSFLNNTLNCNEYYKNINYLNILENNYYIYNKLESLENKLEITETKLNKLINSLAWWIPIKKLRDGFRNKILNSRPDQTRPDQTRMRLHKEYAYLNNTLINNKFQPIFQNKIAA